MTNDAKKLWLILYEAHIVTRFFCVCILNIFSMVQFVCFMLQKENNANSARSTENVQIEEGEFDLKQY